MIQCFSLANLEKIASLVPDSESNTVERAELLGAKLRHMTTIDVFMRQGVRICGMHLMHRQPRERFPPKVCTSCRTLVKKT